MHFTEVLRRFHSVFHYSPVLFTVIILYFFKLLYLIDNLLLLSYMFIKYLFHLSYVSSVCVYLILSSVASDLSVPCFYLRYCFPYLPFLSFSSVIPPPCTPFPPIHIVFQYSWFIGQFEFPSSLFLLTRPCFSPQPLSFHALFITIYHLFSVFIPLSALCSQYFAPHIAFRFIPNCIFPLLSTPPSTRDQVPLSRVHCGVVCRVCLRQAWGTSWASQSPWESNLGNGFRVSIPTCASLHMVPCSRRWDL